MSSEDKQMGLTILLAVIMGGSVIVGSWLMTRISPAPAPILLTTLLSMALMHPILRSAGELASADLRANRKPFFKPRRFAVFYLGGGVTLILTVFAVLSWRPVG
jgi:hypothetical protein